MYPRRFPPALLLLAALGFPALARGAGVASNQNFIVLAPDRPLAEQVAARADAFREHVAEAWFGEALPPGAGAAVIHVELSDTQNTGFTWPKDSPNRKLHLVWLRTTRQAATAEALYHEVVHVVLATRFPDGLPAWVEEGIASRNDDPERIHVRRQLIRRYAQTGNWPDCSRVFTAESIAPADQAAYSVAASVTDFLLARGDKPTLLRFAVSGKQSGWDRALRQHYGLAGMADLERAWQAWASRPSRRLARAGHRRPID
jgi:hypothetical protein